MTYHEALRYLDSFINYEKIDRYDYRESLKLERMKRLAALFRDPQSSIRSVHIAGSKGKGSTASYIYSIMRSAGYKTGLYTSPHLVSFRERIRIDDKLISEEDLARLMDEIRKVIETSMQDGRPTFFEVYTMLAYLYFREKKIDFAVYETGLGGRLDATNLVEPLACAITPISYEHTDKLGDTLDRIAAEKCGIIKRGAPCVSAPQEKEALRVIEKTCAERDARLVLVGRDVRFSEISSSEDGQVFDVFGASGEYRALTSRLIGLHQMMNASVAVGVIEALGSKGIKVPDAAVRKGVADARWEGRLEVVGKEPLIVLDGAQNRASGRALAEAVKKIFAPHKTILVFGASKDKDVRGMLEELLPLATSVILTKSKVAGRALEPSAIEEIARDLWPRFGRDAAEKERIKSTSAVGDAIKMALAEAGRDDLILVTGSLFVIGEARSHLFNLTSR